MAFRANEAAQVGFERVEAMLVPRQQYADESQWTRSKEALRDIIDEIGPVVDAYPVWHPLVCNHSYSHQPLIPVTRPGKDCGYEGLDHTYYFARGFITCPYGDGQEVIDSIEKLPLHPVANITAERLEVQLYNSSATPILVKCNWEKPLNNDGTIPLSIAMPLLLEREIPLWRISKVAETWESMLTYFIGSPHGRVSSLFLSQETGQAMKKIWTALIKTGMYGPIWV